MKAELGVDHRLGDDVVEDLDVGTRRNLGHDPAISGVLGDLREHDIRQDPAVAIVLAFDDGRRSLVASRLDAEHEHVSLSLSARRVSCCAPRPL